MKQTNITLPKKPSLFTKGEIVTLHVFPNIDSMITGVVSVTHKHPRYRLNYVDGTAEEATINKRLDFGKSSFHLVGEIQGEARK